MLTLEVMVIRAENIVSAGAYQPLGFWVEIQVIITLATSFRERDPPVRLRLKNSNVLGARRSLFGGREGRDCR